MVFVHQEPFEADCDDCGEEFINDECKTLVEFSASMKLAGWKPYIGEDGESCHRCPECVKKQKRQRLKR